jgi:hypothetical protein
MPKTTYARTHATQNNCSVLIQADKISVHLFLKLHKRLDQCSQFVNRHYSYSFPGTLSLHKALYDNYNEQVQLDPRHSTLHRRTDNHVTIATLPKT